MYSKKMHVLPDMLFMEAYYKVNSITQFRFNGSLIINEVTHGKNNIPKGNSQLQIRCNVYLALIHPSTFPPLNI